MHSVLAGCEPECSWINYNGHDELALGAQTRLCVGAVEACAL